jgi:hypothetical protein
MIAGALAVVRPATMVTITRPGREWPIVQDRIGRVSEYLRLEGEGVVWAWVVEHNPSGNGELHVHAWAHRGVHISTLEDACRRAGVGRCDVADSRPGQRSSPVSYAFKFVASPQGTIGAQAGLRKHLSANGDRLIHNSRGFWREGDRPLGGLRGAISNYARRMGTSGPWQFVG